MRVYSFMFKRYIGKIIYVMNAKSFQRPGAPTGPPPPPHRGLPLDTTMGIRIVIIESMRIATSLIIMPCLQNNIQYNI